ncbi:hypothetical protein BCR39DRAFT_512410 [Naematelia encephala]|uniref:J domain-containing protein n=1 Tax=Naematelia encephala TaxID=71784 RepID=A0A1Y2BM50_9TREE|nr:hypothetical protein BCR39DRAFT_512410 [Naematelia encephala]
MDDTADPIHQFFSPELASSPDILYETLGVTSSASPEEIKKAYRKQALRCHPDKHASKTETEKEEMGKEFVRVGFAFAVLGDPGRRKRYDETGRTDESQFADAEAMGWDAYFESLFQRIDRKMLDEDKARYQGSEEEINDLIDTYNETCGSLPSILERIPHSTNEDETRFIQLINSLIDSSRLEKTRQWTKSTKDLKASEARKKKAKKEAKQAEQAAKELGVWDEFYGNGDKGNRKSTGDKSNEKQGKANGNEETDGGEGALQAIMLKRQRERMQGLNGLEEKYRKIEEEAQAKKKKARTGKVSKDKEENPPEISDADFDALQAKMFGDKQAKKAKA